MIEEPFSELEPRLRVFGNAEETQAKDNENENITEEETDAELFKDLLKNEKSEKKHRELLCLKDMPDHLQFNRHILTGYRPLQSPIGCINSLFYWHNETINIITHAIPIFYIILTVPDVLPWSTAELRFLAWCHIAGILCPWLGSFVYHLFMNLNFGSMAYYTLLQVDMFGIWVSQSFGALPMVFASTYCLPDIVKWSIIIFYCLLSIWGLYKAMTAWSPWDRRLCFLMPFLTRICLWVLRLSSMGGGDPSVFLHVILQDVVSIAGGTIGAIHIPEKWFPGVVDMYLNSHNLMHVLVVAAVYSMHVATVHDLSWMEKSQC